LVDRAPRHSQGPVAGDWAAIEVWLETIADNSSYGSRETINTYRYHLAKLRWYCGRVIGLPPGRWSMQEVTAFKNFLAELPAHALCARSGKRFVGPDDDGYTPFRKQPAASSQSDILRFIQSMFGALHGTGYLPFNPMQLTKVRKARRLDTSRAISRDVYKVLLQGMEAEKGESREARRLRLHDRFMLIILRELGLRASELVGAPVGAFDRLSDPQSGRIYWVFRVDESSAKGGRERTVPVTRTALDALMAYRQAFGLAPAPAIDDATPLLLSPRTAPSRSAPGLVQSARNRRYAGALGRGCNTPWPVPRGQTSVEARRTGAAGTGRARRRGVAGTGLTPLAAPRLRQRPCAGWNAHPPDGRRVGPCQRGYHHGLHRSRSLGSHPQYGSGQPGRFGVRVHSAGTHYAKKCLLPERANPISLESWRRLFSCPMLVK
jgi:integrase/recombinase XerC